MKTFDSEIIEAAQPFSHKLSSTEVLLNIFWVLVDDNHIDDNHMKTIYVFRQNNELLITRQGEVEKGRWEYIGGNSILVERQKDKPAYLFSHGFLDHNFLVLKINGREGYAFFINQNQYDKGIHSIENVISALRKKYIQPYCQEDLPHIHRLEPPSPHPGKYPTYIRIDESITILRKAYIKATIIFSGSKYGEILISKKNNKAFFRRKGRSWVNHKYCYENPKYCITALYRYLCTGEILQDGLIESFYRSTDKKAGKS